MTSGYLGSPNGVVGTSQCLVHQRAGQSRQSYPLAHTPGGKHLAGPSRVRSQLCRMDTLHRPQQAVLVTESAPPPCPVSPSHSVVRMAPEPPTIRNIPNHQGVDSIRILSAGEPPWWCETCNVQVW